jgi:hypothetical protein
MTHPKGTQMTTSKRGSSKAKSSKKGAKTMTTGAAAPITNSYSTGDFTINWVISGTGYGNCQVTISLQGKQVGAHQFTSGNPSYKFPTASYGGDTLDLTLAYQPPATTANGVLMIMSLNLQQLFGGNITQSNVQLVAWDINGNVMAPAGALNRTSF